MTYGPTFLRGAGLVLLASAMAGIGAAQTSQGTIVGTVVTAESRRPVSDAMVSIPALGRHVTTDSAGRFRMVGVHAGVHGLEARAIGYRPVRREVTVAQDSTVVDFQLKEAVVALPEVLVSTSREQQLAATTRLASVSWAARRFVKPEAITRPRWSIACLGCM